MAVECDSVRTAIGPDVRFAGLVLFGLGLGRTQIATALETAKQLLSDVIDPVSETVI